MEKITWDSVVADKNLDHVEFHKEGGIFRGPIAKITKQENIVTIYLRWCARQIRENEWENSDQSLSPFKTNDVRLVDTGGGKISFRIPFMGVVTIFPKNVGTLNPNKVKNLKRTHLKEVS